MLLATCTLTFAALARVPALGDSGAPVITAALLVVAAAADWMGTRRMHPVYLIGIPAAIAIQALSLYLAFAAPPAWISDRRVLAWGSTRAVTTRQRLALRAHAVRTHRTHVAAPQPLAWS